MKSSGWTCTFPFGAPLPPSDNHLTDLHPTFALPLLAPRSLSAPDNASFASCGGDKAVLIWDVATGTVTRRLQGHFGKVNVVRYAGGGAGAKDGAGNVLVSGSFDSKVMLWDMRCVLPPPPFFFLDRGG